MLSLQNISKRFGAVLALDGCSFSVERGRMLGFLGPNGAGKTFEAVLELPQPETARTASREVVAFAVFTRASFGLVTHFI